MARLTDSAFDSELAESRLTVQEFLKSVIRPGTWWGVSFNLAENRKDENAPFAFMATYTTRLSADAKPQHLPLSKALQEYAGAGTASAFSPLLMAGPACGAALPLVKTMVDGGEIFHRSVGYTTDTCVPKDVPALESSGIVVRMPANCGMNRPLRPPGQGIVGSNVPSHVGMDALLDFRRK